MDSPLILCNIQKCALEQVQAAVEQFGRSDTKHFLHIAPFSISSLEWNSYFMYYYIIVEKLSKNLRGRLQYWFPKYKIDVINFINDFLCFVGMFYRKNSLIFCNKIYNNILQCEYLYALPQYSGVEILGRQRGAMRDIIINSVFKDFILW